MTKPNIVTEKIEVALESILKKENLCVWRVNNQSNEYKTGLLFGITLSWPADKHTINIEIEKMEEKTVQVAQENGLNAIFNGPIFSAGGGIVYYCGLTGLTQK